MTRKMKAILVLFFAAEIVNSAKVGVLKSRIADLETQRDIYASRAQNWIDRAVEDEEVIDSLQIRLDALADGKVELEDEECEVQAPLAAEPRAETAENAPPERWENEPHQAERCLREPSGRSCIR